LEVLRRVPVQKRGGKTASFLKGGFSIFHLKVLTLSTSPKVPKSLKASKSVEAIGGHSNIQLSVREA
jgi:hypothetical protein